MNAWQTISADRRDRDYWEPYFMRKALASLPTGFPTVLDAGCGSRPRVTQYVKDGYVVGVDIGSHVEGATGLDGKAISSLESLAFKDSSFHLIFTRAVIEHVERPAAAIAEFSRVLKKDGALVLQTSNLLNYAMWGARLAPFWLHKRIREKASMRPEPFPTYYRLNTPAALRNACAGAGLEVVEMNLSRGAASYLAFSRVLHAIATAGDTVTNLSCLRDLKQWITVFARKR